MLDHFYLSIQAAVDGLGVVMGPATLIADNLRTSRLITADRPETIVQVNHCPAP